MSAVCTRSPTPVCVHMCMRAHQWAEALAHGRNTHEDCGPIRFAMPCRRAVRRLKLRYHPDKYPGSLYDIMSQVSAFINLQTHVPS